MSLGLGSVTGVDTKTASTDFRSIVLRGANVASYKVRARQVDPDAGRVGGYLGIAGRSGCPL